MDKGLYIQVLLPLRLSWTPWYLCPDSAIKRGDRVSVFFARRQYTGTVVLTAPSPEGVEPSKVRPIVKVERSIPPVSEEELEFWDFLAAYYLCTPGEVYKTACPAVRTKGEQGAANLLERLRSRLAIREEALTKKHRPNVTARLEAERNAIAVQIAEVEKSLSAAIAGPGARKRAYAAPKPELLWGGGREEKYIELCREALSQGLNALVLVPEIAAGEMLGRRFEEAFPGQACRVDSRLGPGRRHRIEADLRSFGAQVIIGTRSALFLPFSRLGLIIVEDEQDIFYKQHEHAPRYNARDAAVMLARIHGARIVLGTPSPSLESLFNTEAGKYKLSRTPVQYCPLEIIDIQAERKKNGMKGAFSRKLLAGLSRAGGRIALVRGWEKEGELLEAASALLPGREVRCLSFQEARMEGLEDYAAVAVMQADFLLAKDDFRADEHAHQTISLLRELCCGTLYIQTERSSHPVFTEADTLYRKLLDERREFGMPPYTRIVELKTGGDTRRIILKPGPGMAAEKASILSKALAAEPRVHTVIDVDPI